MFSRPEWIIELFIFRFVDEPTCNMRFLRVVFDVLHKQCFWARKRCSAGNCQEACICINYHSAIPHKISITGNALPCRTSPHLRCAATAHKPMQTFHLCLSSDAISLNHLSYFNMENNSTRDWKLQTYIPGLKFNVTTNLIHLQNATRCTTTSNKQISYMLLISLLFMKLNLKYCNTWYN